MKKSLIALALGLAAAAGACAFAAPRADEARASEAAQREAVLSRADAEQIALRARAGQIKEWELEREAGGSGLRYSFVITMTDGDYEVGVDARTGAILENIREGPNPD